MYQIKNKMILMGDISDAPSQIYFYKCFPSFKSNLRLFSFQEYMDLKSKVKEDLNTIKISNFKNLENIQKNKYHFTMTIIFRK